MNYLRELLDPRACLGDPHRDIVVRTAIQLMGPSLRGASCSSRPFAPVSSGSAWPSTTPEAVHVTHDVSGIPRSQHGARAADTIGMRSEGNSIVL